MLKFCDFVCGYVESLSEESDLVLNGDKLNEIIGAAGDTVDELVENQIITATDIVLDEQIGTLQITLVFDELIIYPSEDMRLMNFLCSADKVTMSSEPDDYSEISVNLLYEGIITNKET